MTTLEAGRELDARVAVEVMGLPVIEWDANTRCPECGDEMRFCGLRSRCSTCSEWRYGPYREYSDNMSAAWEVVGKMGPRFDGLYPAYDETDDGKEVFMHWVAVYKDDYTHSRRGHLGATAPEAICRAALAAM